MKKKLLLNNTEYEIVENYKDALVINDFEEKFTDYFYEYDYVVGDISYGKLRLKGFYNEDNKKCTKINNIKDLKDYINSSCAYGCKYFVIKKKK